MLGDIFAYIDGLSGGKLTCGGPIDLGFVLKVQPVMNMFLKVHKILRNLKTMEI